MGIGMCPLHQSIVMKKIENGCVLQEGIYNLKWRGKSLHAKLKVLNNLFTQYFLSPELIHFPHIWEWFLKWLKSLLVCLKSLWKTFDDLKSTEFLIIFLTIKIDFRLLKAFSGVVLKMLKLF